MVESDEKLVVRYSPRNSSSFLLTQAHGAAHTTMIFDYCITSRSLQGDKIENNINNKPYEREVLTMAPGSKKKKKRYDPILVRGQCPFSYDE